MKKYLIRIMVAICACALLFGGCAQEEVEQKQTQMETDPSQFLETVNDRLSIDAPVYPFADFNPKVYRATSELFTKEQIEAFLNVCGDSLTGLEDINMDYYIGYDGTTEKGGENGIYSYTTSDVLLPAHFFTQRPTTGGILIIYMLGSSIMMNSLLSAKRICLPSRKNLHFLQ